MMRSSYRAGLLAVFVGILGVGCSAKAPITSTQPSTVTKVPITSTQPSTVAQVSTPQTPAEDKDGVNTPAEASNEASERDREVRDSQVPKSLTDVGNYGETAYDMAKVSDWNKTAANLRLLQQAAGKLPSEIKPDLTVRLNAAIADLSRSITTKNQSTALRQANQVTLIAANMTEQFQHKVPVQVTLLDYYGREFEIWSANGNAAQLKTTSAEFNQTWQALRPTVLARNSNEAKTFDAIVAQTQTAKSPADYGRLATPVLNAVDNLEKVFN
ncbi:MAG: hypothetical protein ABI262_06045 [Microcoleus sp.]